MSRLNQEIQKAGIQTGDDPYEFVLSDETPDRMGDIIRVKGWELDQFKANPVALFAHAHDKMIGTWKNVRIEGKRLIGRLSLAEPGTSELIDTLRKLIEQRIAKAVSVGFMPMEGQPRDKNDPFGGWEFTKAALHEVSVVSVPANPNALSLAKALCPESCQVLFAEPGSHSIGKNGRLTSDSKTPQLDIYRARMKSLGIEV